MVKGHISGLSASHLLGSTQIFFFKFPDKHCIVGKSVFLRNIAYRIIGGEQICVGVFQADAGDVGCQSRPGFLPEKFRQVGWRDGRHIRELFKWEGLGIMFIDVPGE